MTNKENVLCTFVLVLISYVFAIFVPSIGDAMALAGCTTNPMVTILLFLKSLIDRVYHSRDALLGDSQRQAVEVKGKVAVRSSGSDHNSDIDPWTHQFCRLEIPLNDGLI